MSLCEDFMPGVGWQALKVSFVEIKIMSFFTFKAISKGVLAKT